MQQDSSSIIRQKKIAKWSLLLAILFFFSGLIFIGSSIHQSRIQKDIEGFDLYINGFRDLTQFGYDMIKPVEKDLIGQIEGCRELLKPTMKFKLHIKMDSLNNAQLGIIIEKIKQKSFDEDYFTNLQILINTMDGVNSLKSIMINHKIQNFNSYATILVLLATIFTLICSETSKIFEILSNIFRKK